MEELIENYANTPPSKRYAIVVALAFGLVAIHYFMFYDAQLGRKASFERRLTKQMAEADKKRSYVQNMSRYESRFNELQQNLEHARSVLPDEADVPQLLAQLGNKARHTGLNIDYFEPQGEEPQDFYAEIIFGMKLRGSYHEIATFVDAIGKMDRIVNVAGISMTSPKAVSNKIVLEAEFKIKTYKFLSQGKSGKTKRK